MQAASRESLAAGLERLQSRVDADRAGGAGKAGGADLSAVADDVLSVARLLQGEPPLRRALSDPARSGADRAGLAETLLSGKVSADALELVGALVSGRWSSSHDLLDGLELAGIEALLAAAEADGSLEEVEDGLFRLGQVVAGEPRLAAALGDPTAEEDRRRELVDGLLSGKVSAVTLRLAELAVHGFGGRNFDGSVSRLVELAARRRQREVAYVTVAAPLAQSDEDRLAGSLSRIYGRDMSLQVSVDPRVLGGISVQVGHERYDGTILRRLTEARTALAR